MTEAAVSKPEQQDFIVSSLSPSRLQQRLASAVALLLTLAWVVIAGPLSTLHLPQVPAFVPAYAAAMFAIDTITAILLFAQFSILRSRALLVLSSGYLFTALIVVPWMLTFPGVFAPTGLLGGGLQSTNWLYVVWHAGFPGFVVAYALLKDGDRTSPRWRGSVRMAILASVALTATAVGVATLLVTLGDPLLPALTMADAVHFTDLWKIAAGFILLLALAAIVLLWSRRRSTLDLWLMAVMWAFVIEVGLVSFPIAARYTAGWYGGRLCGVVSGSLLLFVLLHEITTVYARLENARLRSDLVRLEQRLRQAEKMEAVGRLAGGIAHDFSNVLGGILAYAEMVLDEAPAQSRLERYAQNVLVAANRGRALVDQILTYSRGQRGKRVPVDVAGVVAEALELVRGSLPSSIRLEPVGLHVPLVVAGDATRLHQVVMNLCSNAVQAMSGGGVLRVRLEIATFATGQALSHGTTEPGRHARLSVEDSGCGMDEATLAYIFEPFFTTKEIGHGTGLGLSLVYAIVADLSGAIDVQSTPGKGSRFAIYLPLEAA